MKPNSQNKFNFHGCTYEYFSHEYNATWTNERAVEVPVAWELFEKYQGKKILEIGNVLSHYFPVDYEIIDKYEKADGVVNIDIIEFQPVKKYDLIISISTLEHVGWDEDIRDPSKILIAIERVYNLLSSNGLAVITLPLGYNTEMDKMLDEKKIQFTRQYYLQRVTEDNKWIEVDWTEIRNAKYNSPFPSANGLVIGYLEKKSFFKRFFERI